MAKFKIQLPHELLMKLHNDARTVEQLQSAGYGADDDKPSSEVPQYPEFVRHLMKDYDTPAQELMHATVGMAGEVGEVLEMFEVTTGLARAAASALDRSKKVWVYGKELDAEALIKELGDLRFYYQAALNWLGVTDEMVRAQNVIKLRARYSEGKYSDAQAIAQNDKRPELPALGELRKRGGPPLERRYMGQKMPTPGNFIKDATTPIEVLAVGTQSEPTDLELDSGMGPGSSNG